MRSIRTKSLALYLIFSSYCFANSPETYYDLLLNCTNAETWVELNGVELENYSGTTHTRRDIACNHWMLDGKNTISLTAEIPEKYRDKDEHGASAYLVRSVKVGEDIKADTLIRVEWKPSKNDTVFEKTASANISVPYAKWLWSSADSLTMEKVSANKEGLNKAITEIHQALAKKDYVKLKSLMKVKTDEMAAAFYIDTVERYKDQKEFFTDMFKEKSFKVEPLDLALLQARPVANGRMLQTQRRGGGAMVRTLPDSEGSVFSIDLYFCFKDGKWILCR